MIYEIRTKLEGEKEPSDDINMAVKITGYSRNTIYKLVNLRQIPHSKQRGKLRFDEKILKQWTQGRERPATTLNNRFKRKS